jgi:predicted alpha/beta-hydrolase family hydrolase
MKPGALLLFPGAGSSASNPSLVAIEQAVAPLPVTRADFPYRLAGKKAPDRPPVLLASVREHAAALVARARIRPNRLVLGGRSMGGRMCSMAVAGGTPGDDGPPLPAAALVLISYPLHPPGQPAKLRVEHLPRLDLPVLFVHGTKDPFATPDELTEWSATIPGPVTHHWVEGKGHDLKGADAQIATTVASWLKALAKP